MDLKALGFSLRFLFFWLVCSDEGADNLSINCLSFFGQAGTPQRLSPRSKQFHPGNSAV